MKHRSIGERLGLARSLQARRETALDWAANWRRDHQSVLVALEHATGRGDIATAGRLLGQLKALNDKAMGALPRVIEALTDDDL